MTVEITELDFPVFREWWDRTHEHSLEEYGFRAGNSIYRAFAEMVDGKPVSGSILIPHIQEGELQGHFIHLASEHRSKALIRFCREALGMMRNIDCLTWICAHTQGNPDLLNVERLARFLGFEPILVQPHGWIDYLWNSKAA